MSQRARNVHVQAVNIDRIDERLIPQPYPPCDELRPHDAYCAECKRQSREIHAAALEVQAIIENAGDLVTAGIEESDKDRRFALLTAVTTLLGAANDRLSLGVLDQTLDGANLKA